MGVADPQIPARDAIGSVQPLWIAGPTICVVGFHALGQPRPKGRPRVVAKKNGPGTVTFTPDETINWENQIGWQAKQAMAWIMVNATDRDGGPPQWPFDGRIMMNLRFNFRRPKSLPKRITHPITGPDIDNLEKCVLDALQNVNMISDDKRVTDLDSVKRYEEPGHMQGVEIEMTAWR